MLVDTTVWIEHFRKGEPRLIAALENDQVIVHPFVIGELACGNIRNRSEVLALLDRLPKAIAASNHEVLALIEQRRLMGRGIGLVDAHLLAAVALSQPARLWTRDRRLATVAAELGMA